MHGNNISYTQEQLEYISCKESSNSIEKVPIDRQILERLEVLDELLAIQSKLLSNLGDRLSDVLKPHKVEVENDNKCVKNIKIDYCPMANRINGQLEKLRIHNSDIEKFVNNIAV